MSGDNGRFPVFGCFSLRQAVCGHAIRLFASLLSQTLEFLGKLQHHFHHFKFSTRKNIKRLVFTTNVEWNKYSLFFLLIFFCLAQRLSAESKKSIKERILHFTLVVETSLNTAYVLALIEIITLNNCKSNLRRMILFWRAKLEIASNYNHGNSIA